MEEINKLGAADVTPRLAARDKSASMSRPSSVFILTPKEILPANRDRLLVHVRNGGYVYNPGEAGTAEATLMAAYGGFKVISFDYRMPPDYPYPAAMDQAHRLSAHPG